MFKRPLLWILLLFAGFVSRAQSGLQVQGISPNLYLSHKVQPKETWYSVGRLYNLSPKEISAYNSTELNAGLSIGQLLKIPLVPANFSQDGKQAAGEALVPVYHTVKEGEWMFRVSTNHNKVPIEQLEKWNNITRNQVKAGMNLVVGYLKVKKDQSALAGGTLPAGTVTVAGASAEKTTPVATASDKGVVSQPAKTSQAPVQAPVQAPGNAAGNPAPGTGGSASIDFRGGFFRSQFEQGSRTAKGLANIFRSTSGWNDGKYYALMDNVPVGTIVQVTNTVSNKYIYAKVLGNLSDIKENAGLTIRISNAAAAELGTGEAKFSAEVKY